MVGDPYFDLETARLRYLGGSSNHWVGFCRGFDEIDFGRSDYLGNEFAWPVSKADVDPYLERASSILEIPSVYADRVESEAGGVQRVEFKFSDPPVRFGEKFRDLLTQSRNISLFLNANLESVDADGGAVVSAGFTSYSGRRLDVIADAYVMAMGGIENSRQLLWQNRKLDGRLFDQAVPVGRHWMEHPHFLLGEALVSRQVTDMQFYSLTADRQRELGILNCGLRLVENINRRSKSLLKDVACVAPAFGRWAAGMMNRDLVCGAILRAAWEQAPVATNRIELSTRDVDRFGVPLAELHWRKTAFDRKTIMLSVETFSHWLISENLGRIRLDPWLIDGADYPPGGEVAGFHHMGGTRMGISPRYGVVDGDCKVFGTKNLYVAGSSIFTTGGHNNPTLPIIQFALRLGDHLATI